VEPTPDALRELADRVEIGELVARYAAAVDDRDFPAVVAFFTEDGTLSRPPWRVTGTADLDAAYRRALGRYEWTVHSVHGHAVDFTGADDAVGFVGCHAEHALNGEVVVVALRYRDEYRRVAGRWRFLSREIGFAYAAAVPGLEPVSRRESSVRWPGEDIAGYGIH
jgi:ketosteroid isomerase-like protein